MKSMKKFDLNAYDVREQFQIFNSQRLIFYFETFLSSVKKHFSLACAWKTANFQTLNDYKNVLPTILLFTIDSCTPSRPSGRYDIFENGGERIFVDYSGYSFRTVLHAPIE
jgi:hypothetical protein